MPLEVAVTGGTGHLGTVVIQKLLIEGHAVRAQHNSYEPTVEDADLRWFKGDITKLEDVLQLIDGCDVVIHSAALISIHQDPRVFDINVGGTKNVIRACLQKGTRRLIHISSTHATESMPHHTPFDENRPLKLDSRYFYDRSKAQSELALQEAVKNDNLDAVILRPGAIMGPPDFKPSFFGQAVIDLMKGNIPTLVGGGYNYVDVRDASDSVISAIENGRKGEAYCISGYYLPITEVSKELKHLYNVKPPRLTLHPDLLYCLLPVIRIYGKISGSEIPLTRHSLVTLKQGHPYIKNDKAMNELGHKPRPWQESLKDLVDWFQSNRYLK